MVQQDQKRPLSRLAVLPRLLKSGADAVHTKHGRKVATTLLLLLGCTLIGLHNATIGQAQWRSSLWPAGVPWRSCGQQAAAQQPSKEEVGRLLGHQVRQLPPTGSVSPVLAATNWEGLASQQHADLPRSKLTEACGGHLFRYRVVSRVVYADHHHENSDTLKWHREAFLEMLVMSVWLYKTFPDVDLWVSFADEPSRCSFDIPILQYTVIGLNETRQAQRSNRIVLQDGSVASVAELLTGGANPQPSREPAPKFYRGWAFNYPWSWEQLSFLPGTMQRYQQCLLTKVGGRPSKPMLIWRGSNTGGGRGWAPLPDTSNPLVQHPWGVALTNKRMALALLARSHASWMNVGLHEVLPELMGPRGSDQQLVQDLRGLMVRPYLPQEDWGNFALQLSLDGHGTPNRLPLQYLQGSSVVLRVMSPFKDSFEELFQAGVDYEVVRYDLSDLVVRGQHLLGRFKDGGQGRADLQQMAGRAGAKAVKAFNLLGQLDALMYAILQVRSVCEWKVMPPPLQQPAPAGTVGEPVVARRPEWQVLQLQRDTLGRLWRSPSLKAGWADSIRQSVLKELAQNFQQV